MCHGAGGMAGHVRFGARTGGALVMLGVILMFGGLELAASVRPEGTDRADRYVMIFTAGVSMWNMGAGLKA